MLIEVGGAAYFYLLPFPFFITQLFFQTFGHIGFNNDVFKKIIKSQVFMRVLSKTVFTPPLCNLCMDSHPNE